MKTIILAAALGSLALGGAATAQSPINARQLNQERRIDAGSRSGKLTTHEAYRLRSQQRYIRASEQRMRARHGGHLTGADKARLHAMQRQANRNILRKKNNGVRKP